MTSRVCFVICERKTDCRAWQHIILRLMTVGQSNRDYRGTIVRSDPTYNWIERNNEIYVSAIDNGISGYGLRGHFL